MNRRPWFLFCALLGLAASHALGQTAPAKGFDAFNLVKTRNLFDPNRKATHVEAPQETRAGSTNRTRPSYVALTGTMVAEGRSLAFFSGSRTEFSKVVPIGDAVAGYKVVSITPLQAELEHGGKSFVLAVGHRLQLEGSTDEIPATETAGGAEASTTPSSPANPNAPAPAAAGGAPPATTDKAEIMRRMIERRQKEMTK